MSCYLRHMKDVLEEANIRPQDRKERKEVDLAIRDIVGMDSQDKCNQVWKEVKEWLQDENKKKELTNKLSAE